MAEKELWIGSVGPLLFDDEDVYDESDEYSETIRGIRTSKILLDDTPTEDDEGVRLKDLNRVILTPIEVVDIKDPSTELGAISGDKTTMLVVYEIYAYLDDYTLYVWDNTLSSGDGYEIPYIVVGLTGHWIAIGGKYNASEDMLKRHLIRGTINLTIQKNEQKLTLGSFTLDDVSTLEIEGSGEFCVIGG